MGPKKIKRSLYAGKGIPAKATNRQVEEAMFDLFETLQAKLKEEYKWLAACTVAVTAGMYGGQRRVNARRKLLGLINECRAHLELKPINPPKGWEQHNLYYGYGALSTYGADHNVDVSQVLLEQLLDKAGADLKARR